MKRNSGAGTRRSLLLSFIVLTLIAAVIVLPTQFRSAATNEKTAGHQTTEERSKGLEDYDFRHQKTSDVFASLMNFRQTSNIDAATIADVSDRFVTGENSLRQTVPTLEIVYNKELGNPEVIGPDVLQGRAFLTQPSNAKRTDILRGFAIENKSLLALSSEQINSLKVTADYTNPNGELSFARMEQFVGDVPVFRAELRAAFNKDGAMYRVVNNLAPALEYSRLSKDFGSPAEAVRRAAGYINHELKSEESQFNETASTDLKAVFGTGDWATTAEKMYFPIEPGVARAAWRVLIWEPVNAYYVIVDAETGTMLYRENIVKDQTQAATFNVYASTTNMIKTMANPAPLATNPVSPALGTQGVLMPRTSITLVGNEAPYTFNNNGWITDGGNTTDGNAVQAGIDRDGANGVDAPVTGTSRVFNFAYTPGAGANNGPGDSPLLPVYQNGAATNLFHIINRYHDETYLLGFTEQARNYQQDNFGRGGLANDRVSAEAQDSSGTNNANFAAGADGVRGRMQMYLWTNMTPNRDGDLDAEIVVHEFTHGLFGRLHNGVGGTQAGQMNEGSADFFGHVMLANETDPVGAISVTGAYATLNLRAAAPFSSVGNYYYGIRRFPKAIMSSTGGPLNRPHNPLTYADIDPARMNLSDGAFAPAFAGSATAVHDGGEIWSSMLWEVRARIVTRLGAAAGNKKSLQLVMDGFKMAPANPTMLQERNSILAAALANGNSGDIADIWAGFAVRGLGFSATNPTGNTVTEGFDLPNATLAATGFAVSDAAPGGDGDGIYEPGELVQLTVPVTNTTGNTVNNVVASVVNGGSANYGNLSNTQTVSRQISYQIPANATCGNLHQVTINVSSDIGTQAPQIRQFQLGSPISAGLTENFDGVTAPALPTGWTQTFTGSNTGFVTATTTADSAPNSARTPNTATAGGADLESPEFAVTSPNAVLNFRNNYNTEATWDGGVLEIKIGSGAYTDIVTAGGTWISGGYNSGVRGTGNPLGTRPAWSGNSNGYITTSVRLPANADGQTVRLKWRMGHDGSVAGNAWNVDSISMVSGYVCSFNAVNKTRADFDGDGKTDLSIFRASEGNWYLNRSTAGFTAVGWGVNGDILTPGDFDGDGKTDVAVARQNAGNLTFYVLNSGNSTTTSLQWGAATDIPVIGDYDGDNKADIAVFRASNNNWYIRNSNGGTSGATFGQSGDIPVANDYDGDGKTDVAVFRPSNATWYINKSSGGVQITPFGLATDKLVPADYNGDGLTDIAVYRPSNGTWYISQNAATNYGAIVFGNSTDVPVPGDYDGDGKYDVAIFRSGTWYAIRSTAGSMTAAFGVNSDMPIAKQYIP